MNCFSGPCRAVARLRLSLAAGADVQLQNKDGWPAPMVAEAGGYPDIAQLLRAYGATR